MGKARINFMSAQQRAALATAVFAIAGIAGSFAAVDTWRAAWPCILFYAMILWNDYHSIAYFSTVISSKKVSQVVIDAALVILNIALAGFFREPKIFSAIGALFFAVATLKYANELSMIDKPELLYRKIVVDIAGTIGFAFLLLANLFGQGNIAMPVEAVLFSIATIYLILINPLYQPPQALQ